MGTWLGEWGTRALHVSHQTEWILLWINIVISLLGIALAYRKFRYYDFTCKETFSGLVYNKFYIDEWYDLLFVRSLRKLSEFIAVTIDINSVDRVIMGFSHGFNKVGKLISVVQNANVRLYALVMMLGVSAFSVYLIVVLG